MLRIPHCLDNRNTDGGKVVCLMHSTPQKHYFSVSGTHFCYRLSKPQGVVRLEGLCKLKKIRSPHRGLEPRTLKLVPMHYNSAIIFNTDDTK
jgi:hypothetical protein